MSFCTPLGARLPSDRSELYSGLGLYLSGWGCRQQVMTLFGRAGGQEQNAFPLPLQTSAGRWHRRLPADVFVAQQPYPGTARAQVAVTRPAHKLSHRQGTAVAQVLCVLLLG